MAFQPNQVLLGKIGGDPMDLSQSSANYMNAANAAAGKHSWAPPDPGTQKSLGGAISTGLGAAALGSAAGTALGGAAGALTAGGTMAGVAGAGGALGATLGVAAAAMPWAIPVIALGAYLFS